MRSVVLVVLVLVAGCGRRGGDGTQLRIAAASDLAKAFDEVKSKLAADGIDAEITYGSSGLLATQIEQGADYSLFAAASKEFADQVAKSGKCDASSIQLYGRGRVVAWVPKGKEPPKSLQDLADPRFKQIAMGNPTHAPYGAAAKQALEKAGVWSKIESKIILAENVQATLVYARDGNADVALVALSLAVVTEGGGYFPIDESLHDPLDQALIVCGSGAQAAAAQQFAAYLKSPAGVELLGRYGFSLPTVSQAP